MVSLSAHESAGQVERGEVSKHVCGQVGPAAPKAAEARASRRAERETVKKFVQLRDFHGDEDKVSPSPALPLPDLSPQASCSSASALGRWRAGGVVGSVWLMLGGRRESAEAGACAGAGGPCGKRAP
eukprot:2627880-Rhodomonas_salina.1